MYRDITHSRICISSLEDPHLNTLKEIKQWFIQGDKQKKDSSQWFFAQCQFDLILSINGFLEIIEYILTNWPDAIIQPRRLSQDMLKGLFRSIREMAGDSSTYMVQSYGYAMNKLTITIQMTSEIQSLNYGLADSLGCVLADLKQRDYRTTDGVENLLVTWSKNIRQMALDSYAGDWFNDFQLLAPDNIKVETQRLIAYILLEKIIRITFRQVHNRQYHDQLFINHTDSWVIPGKIIDLEPAETSKFQYIIRWTIYKLTKSDRLTLAHEEFAKIESCLNVLSSEQLFEKHIEYGPDILIYIDNNLVSNQPLKKQFNDLLQIAYEFYYNAEYKNKELFPEFIHNSIQLSQEAEDYLLNVKAMGIDLKNNAKKDDQPKTKLVTFKKGMLPENLELAL
ncbi:12211_t:CDS:2, partial [Racocetra persica]